MNGVHKFRVSPGQPEPGVLPEEAGPGGIQSRDSGHPGPTQPLESLRCKAGDVGPETMPYEMDGR